MDNEIWKPIIGFEEYYHVSNLGRVKRVKGGKGAQAGRIMKPSLDSGYLFVYLTVNGKGIPINIHRLVAQAFIPNPENKPQVNHKDGNKSNNCVENLEWASCKENVQHAWRTGLCEKTRKKIIETNKSKYGSHRSEQDKKKISETLKSMVWVTNDVNNTRVKAEKLQEYLDKGYRLGRIYRA